MGSELGSPRTSRGHFQRDHGFVSGAGGESIEVTQRGSYIWNDAFPRSEFVFDKECNEYSCNEHPRFMFLVMPSHRNVKVGGLLCHVMTWYDNHLPERVLFSTMMQQAIFYCI